MKVLLHSIDQGGINTYSRYLESSMKSQGLNVILSDEINNYDFDICHIQFEHTLFHPFGLRIIPLLLKLKLKGKKVIITSHTVLSKKEIYSRNKLFTLIKRLLLPLDEWLMSLLYDKIIVHTDYSKKVLIEDYNVPEIKIEVIPHGVYND
jgi:glycosyltransferase involved in cell wall biosynthesis